MLARFGNRRLSREFCRVGAICWDAVHLGRAWFGGDESRASPRASRTLSRTGADIGAGAGPYRDNAETTAGQVPGGRGSGAGGQRVHPERPAVQAPRERPSRHIRHAAGARLVETGSRGAGAGIGHAAVAFANASTGNAVTSESFMAMGSDVVPNRSILDSCPGVTPTGPLRASSVIFFDLRYCRSGVDTSSMVQKCMPYPFA